MNPIKKTDDTRWVLCPSRRFPGKLYYFNIATGETEWCSNETESKSIQKPITKVDNEYSYPEPSSPPAEDMQPTPSTQTVRFTPFHRNTYHSPRSNYPSILTNSQNRHVSTNTSTLFHQPRPFNHSFSGQVLPYQIQVPMVWPDLNTPQLMMVWLNQNAMRPHVAVEELREPLIEPKAPDRDIFVHTGQVPLSQRFSHYRKPVIEFNDNEEPQQSQIYHQSTPTTLNKGIFCGDRYTNNLGPSSFNENDSTRSKLLNKKTIFSVEQNQTNKNPINNNIYSNKYNSNTSNIPFGNKYQNHSQNSFKPYEDSVRQSQNNQNAFQPSQTNQSLFRGSHKDRGFIKQSLCDQNKVSKQSQKKQDCIEQNHVIRELFGQSQTNKKLFDHIPINQHLSGQSQSHQSYIEEHLNDQEDHFQQSNTAKNTLGQSPSQIQNNREYGHRKTTKKLFEPIQANQKLMKKQPNDQNYHKQDKECYEKSQTTPCLSRQYQIKQRLFEDGQHDKSPFDQNQSTQILRQIDQDDFEKTQRVFEHSQEYQEPFEHNQTNQNHSGQSCTSRSRLSQSQVKQDQFSHRQTNQEVHFEPNEIDQDYFEQQVTDQSPSTHTPINRKDLEFLDLPAIDYKLKPTQNPIFASSTPKQSAKADIPKTPQKSTQDIPPCFEELLKPANARAISTVTHNNKVEMSNDVGLGILDKNDLRRILLAKKRTDKMSTINTLEGNNVTKSKVHQSVTPIKKVTFNLDTENVSEISLEEISLIESNYEEVESQKDLQKMKIPSNGKVWYVVTDIRTLLEDFDVLDDFVRLDRKCSLVIPARVMSDIETLSRGECRERRYVILARHSLRKLATPPAHVTVQPYYEDAGITAVDCIINCCREIMENTLVILVTNDEELRKKAESLHIKCFNTEQIKAMYKNKPELEFDITKIKISVRNELDLERSSKICTPEKMTLYQRWMPSDAVDSNKRNINIQEENQIANVNKKQIAFQIQKDACQTKNTDTILKKTIDVPNSNGNGAKYFVNNTGEYEILKRNDSFEQHQTRPILNKKEHIASTFKQANGKIRNKSIFEIETHQPVCKKDSIFEIDGIEKLKSQTEFQPSIQERVFESDDEKYNRNGFFRNSICKNNWASKTQQDSVIEKNCNGKKEYSSQPFHLDARTIRDKKVNFFIFNKDNKGNQSKPISETENERNLSKPSIFETDINGNLSNPYSFDAGTRGRPSKAYSSDAETRGRQSKAYNFSADKRSIFDTENKITGLKPYFEKEDSTDISRNLKLFLKDFFADNENVEFIIECKKDELICGFKQIMEECLGNVLKDESNLIRQKLNIIPPYTLKEALQGVLTVYQNATLCELIAILTDALTAKGDVSASDILSAIWSGLSLVNYLKTVMETTEHLTETEMALKVIMEQAKAPLSDIEPVKTTYISELDDEDHPKHNFRKDRSEVLTYLRKHYVAWADYDETVEVNIPTTSWGKKFKDAFIVRTNGKNLCKLKLGNAKPMSINNPDSGQDIDEVLNPEYNNRNVNFEDEVERENVNKNVNPEDKIERENVNRNVNPEDNVVCKGVNKNVNGNNEVEREKVCRNVNLDDKIQRESVYRNINSVVSKNKKIDEGIDENVGQKSIVTKPTNVKFKNLKLIRKIKNTVPDNKIIENLHTSERNQSSEPKVVRVFNNYDFTKEAKCKKAPGIDVFNDLSLHGHTFGSVEHSGPKVHRNIKPIKEFEEKFKAISNSIEDDRTSNKSTNTVDLEENLPNFQQGEYFDAINDNLYVKNENSDITDDATFPLHNGVTNSKSLNDVMQIDEMIPSTNYMNSENGVFQLNDDIETQNLKNDFDANDDMVVRKDEPTNDIGFESVGVQACYLVDAVLYEIKVSFKQTLEFIGYSIRSLRSPSVSKCQQEKINNMAKSTYNHLSHMLMRFDRIIYRESRGGPRIRQLVKSAGSMADKDERIQNYKQIITRCHDRAEIISNALRMIIDLTNQRR